MNRDDGTGIMAGMDTQEERRRFVVIVEDEDEDAAEALHAFQEPPSWETLRLKDGGEALAYMRQEGKYAGARTPDLVILNILLPKVHGLELLTMLKQRPELVPVPFVMWSVSTDPKHIRFAYEHGATAYFSKPSGEKRKREQMRIIRRFWEGAQLPTRRKEG